MDINEIIKIDEENKRADQNKTDGYEVGGYIDGMDWRKRGWVGGKD
jgi:hypothetical protein